MSQPNRNRQWIFEHRLYNAECTMLRPEVARLAARPMVVQFELPFDCGTVLTPINHQGVTI